MALSHTLMPASRRHRKWTVEEDMVLRSEIEAQRDTNGPTNWTAISEKLPHRSNKDCRKRWLKTVEMHRKGPWTTDEDERLLAAMDIYGTRWNRVAQRVETRNADQCAKHWQHSLDPSIDRGPWTPREDEELLKAVSELGRSWRLIASTKLPSRSPTDLKNRYELMCRRRQEGPPCAMLRDGSAETLGSNMINQQSSWSLSLAQAQCYEICPPQEINDEPSSFNLQSFEDWLHFPPAESQLSPEGGDLLSTATGTDSWITSPADESAECNRLLSMPLPARPSSRATPVESSAMLPDEVFPPSMEDGAGLEHRTSLTSYTLVLENIHSTKIGDVLNSLTERGLMLNMRVLRQMA